MHCPQGHLLGPLATPRLRLCAGSEWGIERPWPRHAAQLCPTPCHPQGNHVFTSGATGTNAAVIRGALRAERPELLTVVLPQSLSKQPQESQELIKEVRGPRGCVCGGVRFAARRDGACGVWARENGLWLGISRLLADPGRMYVLQVQNVISMPQNDHLSLMEASR